MSILCYFLTRSFFLGKKLRTRRRRSCSRITKKPGHFPYIKQLYIYYRYVTIYISFYILKMTWFFRVFLFIILFFRFCYCSKLAHMSFYKICRIQFSMPKNNIEGHCTTRRKRFINSHFICNNIQFSIWNCNFHFAILVHKILSIYNQINGSTSIRQGICPLGKKKG